MRIKQAELAAKEGELPDIVSDAVDPQPLAVFGSATDEDERLLALLRADGRQSNKELGDQLGLSAKQAGARLRRLLEGDQVRVIATVDSVAAGFQFMLAIAVEVDGPVNAVARELAGIPNVLVVMRMAGRYDIEIVLAADTHAALSEIVTGQLAAIPGIRSLHPSLVLDVAKFEAGFGRNDAGVHLVEWPEKSAFDAVDKLIVERLWANARTPNEAIAVALGLGESTVRMRIAQMRRRRLIHITAIRNVELGHDILFAFIGVELSEGAREAVIRALAAMPHTAFVANVLGRFDILTQVAAPDAWTLTAVLDSIAAIPGVRHASCAQGLSLVKYDPRFALLTHQAGKEEAA